MSLLHKKKFYMEEMYSSFVSIFLSKCLQDMIARKDLFQESTKERRISISYLMNLSILILPLIFEGFVSFMICLRN